MSNDHDQFTITISPPRRCNVNQNWKRDGGGGGGVFVSTAYNDKEGDIELGVNHHVDMFASCPYGRRVFGLAVHQYNCCSSECSCIYSPFCTCKFIDKSITRDGHFARSQKGVEVTFIVDKV